MKSIGSSRLLVLSFVILTTPAPSSGYADPTLTPAIVRDGLGNVADEESAITWSGRLPEGGQYSSADEVTDDDNVNGPLYAMVDGFTAIVQTADPPYELLSGLLKSDLDLSGQTMTLVKFAVGIAVCFAVGIIFMIIMPLVCCCFCCCRMCGRCGGKLSTMHRLNEPSCWCRVHTIMIFVVSISMIAGCGLFISSAAATENGTKTIIRTTKSNIQDVPTFLTNVVEEVNFLVLGSYNFSADVMKRDLDNIDFLVGLQVREKLSSEAGIEAQFSALLALDNDSSSIQEGEEVIDADTRDITVRALDLENDIEELRSRLQNVSQMSGCNATCQAAVNATSGSITTEANYSQLPDLALNIALMKKIVEANLSSSIFEDQKNFREIPERIGNQTKDQVADIKSKIDSYRDDIKDSLSSITDLSSPVESYLKSFTPLLDGIHDSIDDYTKYIIYFSYGVVTLVAVVVLFLILGACGAICYYDYAVPAPKRSKSSHCVGNVLMAAVGLSFIISWIMVPAVSFPFVIGIILDRDICDQLAAPEYPLLRNVIDLPNGPLGDGYLLSEMILQDPTVPLRISGVLSACSQNQPVYRALKLENIINTTDYESMNLSSTFDGVDTGFNISLLSSGTTDILEIYKNATDIDYLKFDQILTSDVVKSDFIHLADDIRNISAEDPAKTELQSIADDVERIYNNNITAIQSDQKALLEEVWKLRPLTEPKPDIIDNVTNGLKTSESYISNNSSGMIASTLKSFQDRILGVVHSYVNRTKQGMENDVGKCRPLYNVWSSIIDGEFCRHLVQPFNGMWFTLGWLVFSFIPAIIYGVKLSKYIRIMKYKKNVVEPAAPVQIWI